MSHNRSSTQSQNRITFYLNTYLVSLVCSNAALLIGHPAERLKVAAQIHLNTPTFQVIRPMIFSLTTLYTGLLSCVYRQNIKIVYRSFIMVEVPHRVDNLNLNFIFSSALKAFFASSIDTLFVTPAENVKTWQMSKLEKTPIHESINGIYHTRGLRGFLFGAQPTVAKSFPSWFYLFLGYHATEDKRKQQNFLSTIFWATIASIPITILTNPADVIKTQMQATKKTKSDSPISVGKQLIQNHGLFSLAKGFPFRLLHKSLATATAYTVMDMGKKFKS